jgi:hypothetical protein
MLLLLCLRESVCKWFNIFRIVHFLYVKPFLCILKKFRDFSYFFAAVCKGDPFCFLELGIIACILFLCDMFFFTWIMLRWLLCRMILMLFDSYCFDSLVTG